jgi:hypothetical protein
LAIDTTARHLVALKTLQSLGLESGEIIDEPSAS